MSDHLQELADAIAANPRVQRRIAEDSDRSEDGLSYVSEDDLRALLVKLAVPQSVPRTEGAR